MPHDDHQGDDDIELDHDQFLRGNGLHKYVGTEALYPARFRRALAAWSLLVVPLVVLAAWLFGLNPFAE